MTRNGFRGCSNREELPVLFGEAVRSHVRQRMVPCSRCGTMIDSEVKEHDPVFCDEALVRQVMES